MQLTHLCTSHTCVPRFTRSPVILGTPEQLSHLSTLHTWAHLCAVRCLTVDPGRSSGRCYFITDDTPVVNSFQSLKPYLDARGYTLSTSHLPYPLAYALYLITDWLLWVARPIHEVNLEVTCCLLLWSLTFDNQNLRLLQLCYLLGPFHGDIAVPSVTRCRCSCRRRWRRWRCRGHRCAGSA